jgi:hypothetical protein
LALVLLGSLAQLARALVHLLGVGQSVGYGMHALLRVLLQRCEVLLALRHRAFLTSMNLRWRHERARLGLAGPCMTSQSGLRGLALGAAGLCPGADRSAVPLRRGAAELPEGMPEAPFFGKARVTEVGTANPTGRGRPEGNDPLQVHGWP